MARQTLQEWIHEALADEDKGKPCTALALVHRVGVREQEIHSKKLSVREDAKSLAKMFLGKAENYAAELPGVQTFNLLAFYGDNPQWEAIKPFMINGVEEMPGLSTEGPTKEGLVQQSMRHSESVIQMAFRQTTAMSSAMTSMFEMVVRENMSLRRENQDATVILRDAVLDMNEKKEEAAFKRMKFQRDAEERSKWLSFGPAFVNTLLGKEVFPQSTADTSLIDTIADSISEEDMQRLAASGIIKTEVWGPLAARMAKHLERKRLAEAQAKTALNGVDPEIDAMGGSLLTEGEVVQ